MKSDCQEFHFIESFNSHKGYNSPYNFHIFKNPIVIIWNLPESFYPNNQNLLQLF